MVELVEEGVWLILQFDVRPDSTANADTGEVIQDMFDTDWM